MHRRMMENHMPS